MTGRPSSLIAALALPACFACLPGRAQEVLVPAEQVRYDYAQVLNVQPVYQVLNANARERRCHLLTQRPTPECRDEVVPIRLQRPIAYDVDYTYRGVKYRSRLAQDPGRRLRIRIGITPVIGSEIRP